MNNTSDRVLLLLEELKKGSFLTFESIMRVYIDRKDFLPFIYRGDTSLSDYDLATIIQFLVYGENITTAPTLCKPLSKTEKDTIVSKVSVKNSKIGLHPDSYSTDLDSLDMLSKLKCKYFVSANGRYLTINQKIVDLAIVGLDREIIEEKWKELVNFYEEKKREMITTASKLYQLFHKMIEDDLVSTVTIRGQVGTEGRPPTEDDIDILLFATKPEAYPQIRGGLSEKVTEFRTVNWVEQRYDDGNYCSPVSVLQRNPRQKYDLDVWAVASEKEDWILEFHNGDRMSILDQYGTRLLDDMKVLIRKN